MDRQKPCCSQCGVPKVLSETDRRHLEMMGWVARRKPEDKNKPRWVFICSGCINVMRAKGLLKQVGLA